MFLKYASILFVGAILGSLLTVYYYVPHALSRDFEALMSGPEEINIRYDESGRIRRARFSFRRWEDFYSMVARESGFEIKVANLPKGGISTVVNDIGWEQVLKVTKPNEVAVIKIGEGRFSVQ